MASFEDRALKVGREEGQAKHAPRTDHVRCRIENGLPALIAPELSVGLLQGPDKHGIAARSPHIARDDLTAAVADREPERDDQGLEALVVQGMWIGMQRDDQTVGLDDDSADPIEWCAVSCIRLVQPPGDGAGERLFQKLRRHPSWVAITDRAALSLLQG